MTLHGLDVVIVLTSVLLALLLVLVLVLVLRVLPDPNRPDVSLWTSLLSALGRLLSLN